MKKVLPLILIVAGIGFAIAGYTKYNDSGGGIQIGDLEISAQDSGKRNQAYVLFGIGGVCFISGLMLFKGSK